MEIERHDVGCFRLSVEPWRGSKPNWVDLRLNDKSTLLNEKELDELITVLSYYKLEVFGK